MSFPGWSDQLRRVRVPLAAIDKRFCIKHKTMDEMLDIIAWSLRFAFAGQYPKARHDGMPWRDDKSWHVDMS